MASSICCSFVQRCVHCVLPCSRCGPRCLERDVTSVETRTSFYLGFSAIGVFCFHSSLYAIFRLILYRDFLFVQCASCWLSGRPLGTVCQGPCSGWTQPSPTSPSLCSPQPSAACLGAQIPSSSSPPVKPFLSFRDCCWLPPDPSAPTDLFSSQNLPNFVLDGIFFLMVEVSE